MDQSVLHTVRLSKTWVSVIVTKISVSSRIHPNPKIPDTIPVKMMTPGTSRCQKFVWGSRGLLRYAMFSITKMHTVYLPVVL